MKDKLLNRGKLLMGKYWMGDASNDVNTTKEEILNRKILNKRKVISEKEGSKSNVAMKIWCQTNIVLKRRLFWSGIE